MRERTVLIFALCAALVVPCFGSGQGGAAAQGAGHTVSANLNPTGLPIVKQRETYIIAMPRNALSQNNMVEKEPVLQAVKDTNIEINWMEIPGSSFAERINIMFASGDLPDAIVRPSVSILLQNLNQASDLTDLIDAYSPALSRFFKARPDIKSLVTAPDGRIYCFPSGDESFWAKTDDCLFINKTWLDALKMAAPATTDEFYTMLKAFKENDMNGNGNRNDEIPFAFCQANGGATLNSMFGSFDVLDNAEHIQVINGVATFSPARPEFLEALRYYNKLYVEGLMDSEGFSQSLQQYTAKGRENPAVYGSFIAGVQANIIGVEKLPDYIPVAPLKGPGGKQLWNAARNTGVIQSGFVITKKCGSPETLVRWYDYINSSLEMVLSWELGPKGVSWEMTNNNTMWKQLDGNIPAGSSWGEFRHTVGVASSGPQCGLIPDRNNPAVRTFEDANTLNKIASLAVQEAFLPAEILPIGLEEPAVIQERGILYADIDTYVRNFVSTSIMEGITDARWNEHLGNIQRLNIPRYLELYQALYDRSN